MQHEASHVCPRIYPNSLLCHRRRSYVPSFGSSGNPEQRDYLRLLLSPLLRDTVFLLDRRKISAKNTQKVTIHGLVYEAIVKVSSSKSIYHMPANS